MIPISTTASLVDIYPNIALISFAVYYRVYSSGGGDKKAKTSFDESDISLGRINTLFITPPHTAASLKACIAKVEDLVTPGHALYKDMEIFQGVNSDAAMSDTDVISFLGDTYPGNDEGDPVALVNATGNVLSQYQQHQASANRPLSDSKFTKRAPFIYTHIEEKAAIAPTTDAAVEEVPFTEAAVAEEARATEEAKPVHLFSFRFYSH